MEAWLRWQALAAACFAALFLRLRAWRGGGQAGLWIKAWTAWMAASLVLAYLSLFIVESFPHASPWLARWDSFRLQARLWMLACAFPLFGALADLERDEPGFPRAGLGFWLGLALAPWLAGAYPLSQFLALLIPVAFLGCTSHFLLPSADARASARRVLKVLAAFHLLAFANALWPLGVFGSAALVALMAAGLSPFGPRAGLAGTALGLLALALRHPMGIQAAGWRASVLVTACIALGWALSRMGGRPGREGARA